MTMLRARYRAVSVPTWVISHYIDTQRDHSRTAGHLH
jgi:hypothetical protein